MDIFDKAEEYCRLQKKNGESGRLVTVASTEEQNFLVNYLFKEKKISDNVWLGALLSDNETEHFSWIREVQELLEKLARLQAVLEKTVQKNREEAQTKLDEVAKKAEDSLAGIAKKTEDKINELNESQKKTEKSLSKVQKKAEETSSKVDKNKVSIENVKQKSDETASKLDSTSSSLDTIKNSAPVPIGFIYVQLPYEQSPKEIWPSNWYSWTEVSEAYAGVFFRVVGGDAAEFGNTQEADAPHIDKILQKWCWTNDDNTCSKGATSYDSEPADVKRNISLSGSSSESWSDPIWSANKYRKGDQSSSMSNYLTFHNSGGEIRPLNMAVRVWKRTVFDKMDIFDKAEEYCRLQKKNGESGRLVTVASTEEQNFLVNYLFKEKKISDNVWLGALLSDNETEHFSWIREVQELLEKLARLQAVLEKTVQKNREEAQTKLDEKTEKSLSKVQKKAEETSSKVDENKVSIENVKQKSDETARKLDSTSSSLDTIKNSAPVPIGFIYVQLPYEQSPKEIWPSNWYSWTEVSEAYAGVFFRVVGGDAAEFGNTQEADAPHIDKILQKWCWTNDDNTCSKGATSYDSEPADVKRNISLSGSSSESWSDPIWSANKYRKGDQSSSMSNYLTFHNSGGEIRPLNMAVRVWKRTAFDLCGSDGWTQYKDEKCIKIFSQQIFSFKEAETFCILQNQEENNIQVKLTLGNSQAEPRLLTITTAEEQKFIVE
ncbi:hypothetical protein TYRP_011194 [Tyrophagus putrescentiae]|nr:hypothetical protein TYRP_011194 [Tyrophagus putrescentiae]